MIKCSTTDCDKPISKLKCPTCVKLGLPDAFFCSQECFQRFWPIHKLFHKKQQQLDEHKSKFNYSGPLRPGKVSKQLTVPEHIKYPDYAVSSTSQKEEAQRMNKICEVKSFEELEMMREIGILSRQTIDYAHSLVKEGVTTDYIDAKTHEFIIENNAYPSPLNYYKFPKSLCTSVNEVICHGIPDDRPLQNGDIVNLDITVYKNGFHSDLNETYYVGQVPESSKFLVESTYKALELAQNILKPGAMFRNIGNVIGKFIQEKGLSVTKSYTGHGIGNLFHCVPNVPHYMNNKAPGFMKIGNVFTIEPMINQGTSRDILWPDDWTAATEDGQRSAQFEHTYVITEGGYEILTARRAESPSLDFNIQ